MLGLTFSPPINAMFLHDPKKSGWKPPSSYFSEVMKISALIFIYKTKSRIKLSNWKWDEINWFQSWNCYLTFVHKISQFKSQLIFLQPASSLLAVAVELFRQTPLKVFLGFMLKIFLKYEDLTEILSNIFSGQSLQ